MNDTHISYTARPTLQIDLDAIKENYQALKKKVGKAHVAGVVKADAYGLGAERVGRALYGAGCRNFFVATAGEGKILRESIGESSSIYVLNGPAPRDLPLYFKAKLKPVINSLRQAKLWATAASASKYPPYSALHIDTGINRLGFETDGFEKLLKNKNLLESLQLDLVMSHLSCAPEKDHPLNVSQLKGLRQAAGKLPIMPISLANTAGIYLGRPYHFQMVRPGIGLYGGAATNTPKQETLRPVVSLMAPILQFRTLKAGDSLGYNASYTAKENRHIAIIAAGYADGVPVSASSGLNNQARSHVILRREMVPIAGRVSMDLTALDITNMKGAPQIGDWAEFYGTQLNDAADNIGVLNYELLTRLGQRAARKYI